MGAVGGVGLGLRWELVDELIARTAACEAAGGVRLAIDFLEIAPENYMGRGGKYLDALAWLADRYPIVTHGLTMSIGGSDPLDGDYLRDLAAFVAAFGSPWHSDHMCFGMAGGRALHDLLPIAFRRDNVARVADRARRARDVVRVPFAIENVSYYAHPGRADMGEAEFLSRVCDAAGCGLLLDVNNAYVNARNFGHDATEWLRAAPLDRVVQIHVAGHEWFGLDERGGLSGPAAEGAPDALIVDTHGADAPPTVLALLEHALSVTGPVPVLLERDQNIPPLDALLIELAQIRAVWERASVNSPAAPSSSAA